MKKIDQVFYIFYSYFKFRDEEGKKIKIVVFLEMVERIEEEAEYIILKINLVIKREWEGVEMKLSNSRYISFVKKDTKRKWDHVWKVEGDFSQ